MARELANILSNGGSQAREGPSRYNKLFTFQCMLDNVPCEMVVTSVTGHLMEMDFDASYKKWSSCDPVELFEAPIRTSVPDDKIDVRRNLEQVRSRLLATHACDKTDAIDTVACTGPQFHWLHLCPRLRGIAKSSSCG